MYTTRNCRGLKEVCPKLLGTRGTWAMRMGRDKRHPTDGHIRITKEWDVECTRVRWQVGGDAASKLRMALECDNQVEVLWDEVGLLSVWSQAANGEVAAQRGQSKVEAECGEQSKKWVEEDNYPWSLEDEFGFFGAYPERGVG